MVRRWSIVAIGVLVAALIATVAWIVLRSPADDRPTREASASATDSASPSAAPSDDPAETPAQDPPDGGSADVPNPEASSSGAIAIRGDWHDPDAAWIVHFEEDGTFTTDDRGRTDFVTGLYSVSGRTVTLRSDDGDTFRGAVRGRTLVFDRGTLVRQ